jgi:hypothetical protein
MAEKTRVELEGVPETLLWNLYNRAVEALRADALLRDPLAVELVDGIDYPFERFGEQMSQWHALRVLCFDREVRRFLRARPGGTVVGLGEGLETQFWRVDDGRVRWLTVDLPETVEVRRRLLDAVPHGLAERSRRGDLAKGAAYQAPPWHWSLDPGEHEKIKAFSPHIAGVRDLRLPRGRGALAIAPWAHLIPLIRKLRMPIVEVRFAG